MRGAWIEMLTAKEMFGHSDGRSPCGGRGLKLFRELRYKGACKRRSPCGGRGLKWMLVNRAPVCRDVAPHAGGVD